MLSRTSKPVPATGKEILDPETWSVTRAKRRSRMLVEWVRRRRGPIVFLLLSVVFLASFYVVSSKEDYDFALKYPPFYKQYNASEETVDGYLVWNTKCQMLSKDPMDRSIRSLVKKEKYEKCATEPPLTRLSRDENGSTILFVDPTALSRHPGLRCCWFPVYRPEKQPPKPTIHDNIDSSIVSKQCETLEGNATIPEEAYAAMVTCNNGKQKSGKKHGGKPLYENVHPILDIGKVRNRYRQNETNTGVLSRKLSVLLLGFDSVSRLNFLRSVPNTESYLRETGWIRLDGYNKMGDNTFPNLMAILTGQSEAQAYSVCKPTIAGKLDQCSFIWNNFRDAGYATAYGEDETSLNTFNFLKMGFVKPPTDYYLRPCMLACEKLLKVKRKFGLKYCTGPETSFDRILDYGLEFARTFLGLPYFGLFWTVSVSHENVNGLSSMDVRLLNKLKRLERDGVLNDTMIVLLSDHGMRWGPIRNTFIGWYEERLPFLYFWLPEWFRAERPEAYASLRANRHRLTSPFDLYETLREVVTLSGGQAAPSPGCPECRSLIGGPVPRERGCLDAGISSHWCACTAFGLASPDDATVQNGARHFLSHVDNVTDGYRDKKGRRLCAKLRLKKLFRVDRVIDFGNSTNVAYFYMIQTTPGDGKFEVTVRYHENGTYSVSDHEVSRLNQYGSAADCLDRGIKQYCYCLK